MNSIELSHINVLPFTLLEVSEDGYITACIKQLEGLTGYSNQELVGKAINQLFPQLPTHFTQQYNKGALHLTLYCKNQHSIDCSLSIDKVNQHYVFYIAPQAKAEYQYEPSTLHELQPVARTTEDAFWKWDLENQIVDCSSMVMSILGYSAETFNGPVSFWKKHITPKGRSQIQSQLSQHFKGKIPCINTTQLIETQTGESKWITLIGKVFESKDSKPYKMIGSVKDVTEHHVISEQLKIQNGYLQLAEQIGNSGHWRLDLINNTLFWSAGVYRIHGVTPDKYKPELDTAINFYLREEQEKVGEYIEQAIETKTGFHFKSVIKQPFGRTIKVESLGEVELDEHGEVIGVFGVFKDIQESEEAYEKVKLLAMVNSTIKVPIFFIDEKDNIVYQDLSPKLENKKTVLFNYINFSITEYLNYKKKAKETGQIKHQNVSFDKFNSVFDLSVTYEKDEGIYIWIVNNVTDAFRAEQQQIISNRLALLGNTFGNVSHDINNVLGVALGATEMLELKYSQGKTDIAEYIDRVKNAIDKGKSVTERLLAFTRKPTVKVVRFDPIKEIESNKYLFKQLLLSTIDFSIDIDNVHCEINFPQGEFINILLNLVLNSQDAIREQGLNGRIEITANINSHNKLEIHVKDSGIGIEQNNLSKIFDPFYSSKSVNKGNGIGLANVYNTVYKHNGEIQVEGSSSLGGAHFTLIFSCKLLKEKAKTKEVNKSSTLNLHGKKILILDDEVSIAEFVSLYLENEGGETVHVNNKEQLIDAVNQHDDFDIFITDMILPDISGRQAVDLILQKFPSIQICSMSGYIAEESEDWKYPVLRKPFNSKDLKSFLKQFT